MEDIKIRSKYSKAETIERIRTMFRPGNEYDVELQVLHGEYYLKPAAYYATRYTSEPFFLQFRLIEDKSKNHNQVTIEISPQSKILAKALGIIFLGMTWIIIFSVTLSLQRWLGFEVYLGGLVITAICLLLFRKSATRENQIIKLIIAAFEMPV